MNLKRALVIILVVLEWMACVGGLQAVPGVAEWVPQEREEWAKRLDLKREQTRKLVDQMHFGEKTIQALHEAAAQGKLPMVIQRVPNVSPGMEWYQISLGCSFGMVPFVSRSGGKESFHEVIRQGLLAEIDRRSKTGASGGEAVQREELARWIETLDALDPEQVAGWLDSPHHGTPIRFGARLAASEGLPGVRVMAVTVGSPAAAVSLAKNDIIQKVEKKWVRTPRDFFTVLEEYGEGSHVRLHVLRPPATEPLILPLVMDRAIQWHGGPAIASTMKNRLEEQRKIQRPFETEHALYATLSVEQFARDYGPRLTLAEMRMQTEKKPVLYDSSYAGPMPAMVMLKPSKQDTLEEIRGHMTDPAVLPEWKRLEAYLQAFSEEEYRTTYEDLNARAHREATGDPGRSSTPPRPATMAWAGIQLAPPLSETLKGEGHQPGVKVQSVVKGGPADQAGVKAGDRVMTVEKNLIVVPEDLATVIRQFAVGSVVHMEIKREDAGRFQSLVVRITLGVAPSP